MNRVYRLSTRFGQQPASCLCSAMIRAHRLSTRFGQQPASCLCSAMNRVYRLSTRFGAKPAERTQHAGLRAGRLRPAGLFEAEQTAALLSGVSCGPPTSSRSMRHPTYPLAELHSLPRFCRVYPAARRHLRDRCRITYPLPTPQPPHACQIPLTFPRPLAGAETATACRKARRHTLPRRKQTAPP